MERITDVTATVLDRELLERLSLHIHESPNATRRVVEQAVPISIAGLASHASSEQGAAQLLGALRGGDYPHADAREIAVTATDPEATTRLASSGAGFMSQILGNKLPGVVDTLAGQTGVSKSSAATLLGLAAPLVLDAVGKEAGSRRLDARGLSLFLADQGRQASGVLPESVSSALGTGAVGRGASVEQRARQRIEDVERRGRTKVDSAEQRARDAAADVRQRMRGTRSEDILRRDTGLRAGEIARPHEPKRRGFGLWIAAGLALLAALGLWMARRGQAPAEIEMPAPTAEAPQVTPPATPEPQQAAPAQPAEPAQQAPAQPAEPAQQPEPAQQAAPAQPAPTPQATTPGAAPSVAVLSAATGVAALNDFLTGDAPTPQRFVLDGLEFSTSSSQVGSNSMLNDVAKTLVQHPNAKVRIEGHTDATGDPEANEELSQARADAVKSNLVSQGVAADRIEAGGRGSDQPVGSNESAAGRAENRRVDLIVVQR